MIYRDHEDVLRKHWFDLLLTLKSGIRIAYAVKPTRYVAKQGLRELLLLMAGQIPQSFAHGIGLLTEKELRPTLVHNATLIHEARRSPSPDADHGIRAVVETLNGSITIDGLIKAAGLDGAGFQAVARAIGDGSLVLCRPGRISRTAWVRRTREEDGRP